MDSVYNFFSENGRKYLTPEQRNTLRDAFNAAEIESHRNQKMDKSDTISLCVCGSKFAGKTNVVAAISGLFNLMPMTCDQYDANEENPGDIVRVFSNYADNENSSVQIDDIWKCTPFTLDKIITESEKSVISLENSFSSAQTRMAFIKNYQSQITQEIRQVPHSFFYIDGKRLNLSVVESYNALPASGIIIVLNLRHANRSLQHLYCVLLPALIDIMSHKKTSIFVVINKRTIPLESQKGLHANRGLKHEWEQNKFGTQPYISLNSNDVADIIDVNSPIIVTKSSEGTGFINGLKKGMKSIATMFGTDNGISSKSNSNSISCSKDNSKGLPLLSQQLEPLTQFTENLEDLSDYSFLSPEEFNTFDYIKSKYDNHYYMRPDEQKAIDDYLNTLKEVNEKNAWRKTLKSAYSMFSSANEDACTRTELTLMEKIRKNNIFLDRIIKNSSDRLYNKKVVKCKKLTESQLVKKVENIFRNEIWKMWPKDSKVTSFSFYIGYLDKSYSRDSFEKSSLCRWVKSLYASANCERLLSELTHYKSLYNQWELAEIYEKPFDENPIRSHKQKTDDKVEPDSSQIIPRIITKTSIKRIDVVVPMIAEKEQKEAGSKENIEKEVKTQKEPQQEVIATNTEINNPIMSKALTKYELKFVNPFDNQSDD